MLFQCLHKYDVCAGVWIRGMTVAYEAILSNAIHTRLRTYEVVYLYTHIIRAS